MRGLKRQIETSQEFVATCHVCGAALRRMHLVGSQRTSRCLFCGATQLGPGEEREGSEAYEEPSPLALLTQFEKPRRYLRVLLVLLSVGALVGIGITAFPRERLGIGTAPPPNLPTASPTVAADPAPPALVRVKVILEAASPVWVRAAKDGGGTTETTLAAGEQLVVIGQQKVALRLGNTEDVTVRAGGHPVAIRSAKQPLDVLLWLRDGALRIRRTPVG
jgi:hypothetical protein